MQTDFPPVIPVTPGALDERAEVSFGDERMEVRVPVLQFGASQQEVPCRISR